MLEIGFHGGAGTVTGSRHLVIAGNERVLVDCGMYQGLKSLRFKNWEPRSNRRIHAEKGWTASAPQLGAIAELDV